MGVTDFMRGAGHRIASVGRAVQAASQKLDQAVAPQPTPLSAGPAPSAPAPNAPAPSSGMSPYPVSGPMPQQPIQRGFTLPDLGPAPDATAPQYQSDEGKKQLESDLSAYQHKLDVHRAFQDLDRMYAENHPGRDFQGEYEEQLRMQREQEAARPKGSNLARAALALGDFNPAVQQSGRSNLDTYNKNVEEDAARSDDSFAKRMLLRRQMHESAANEAEQKGNFRKALAEQEKLALLKIDTDQQEQKNKMQQIGATADAANKRAVIRADAMKAVAQTRASSIAAAHGLAGTFLSEFQKQMAKVLAAYGGPKDLMKDYTMGDLDTITQQAEQWAEFFHDKQQGTNDGGAQHFQTHPGNRPQSSTTTDGWE